MHKVRGDDLKKLLGGSFVQVLDDQRFISRLAFLLRPPQVSGALSRCVTMGI